MTKEKVGVIPVFLFPFLLTTILLGALFSTVEHAKAAPDGIVDAPHIVIYPMGLILTSTKTVSPDGIVDLGTVLTYTIVFTANNNTGTVVITDRIPDYITYGGGSITGTSSSTETIVPDDAGWSVDRTLLWMVTDVTPDSIVTLTFTGTVDLNAGYNRFITNTGWVSDSSGVYFPDITVQTSSPAISVTKTVNRNTAYVGEVISYTYWVTNTGNRALDNILVTDDKLGEIPLPAADLAIGASVKEVATHTVVSGDLPGPLVNTVLVTGSLTGGGIVTATDTASVAVGSAVYLPLIVKPANTELYVTAINTGGITSMTIGPYNCSNVPIVDGTNRACGTSFPPGTYNVVAITNNCGRLDATGLPFYSGADYITIRCN